MHLSLDDQEKVDRLIRLLALVQVPASLSEDELRTRIEQLEEESSAAKPLERFWPRSIEDLAQSRAKTRYQRQHRRDPARAAA